MKKLARPGHTHIVKGMAPKKAKAKAGPKATGATPTAPKAKAAPKGKADKPPRAGARLKDDSGLEVLEQAKDMNASYFARIEPAYEELLVNLKSLMS